MNLSSLTSEQLSGMLIILLSAIIFNVVAETAIAYGLGIRSKKGMTVIALTNVLTTIFLTNPCFMFAMGSGLLYACVLHFAALDYILDSIVFISD